MNEGRVALKFDLSQVSENTEITEAKLSVFVIRFVWSEYGDSYAQWDKDATFKIHRITESWSESSANWDNLSESFDATPEDTSQHTTGSTGWYEFDVTDAIIDMVKNGDENHGFMLMVENTIENLTSGTVLEVASSEYGEQDKIPRLKIN